MDAWVWVLIAFFIICIIVGIVVVIYFLFKKEDTTTTPVIRVPSNLKSSPSGDLSIILNATNIQTSPLYGVTDVNPAGNGVVLARDTTDAAVTCTQFKWNYGTHEGITDTLQATWETAPNQYLSAQLDSDNTPKGGEAVATRTINPPVRTQWTWVPDSGNASRGRWCLKADPNFCLFQGSGSDNNNLVLRNISTQPAQPSTFYITDPITTTSTPVCKV